MPRVDYIRVPNHSPIVRKHGVAVRSYIWAPYQVMSPAFTPRQLERLLAMGRTDR